MAYRECNVENFINFNRKRERENNNRMCTWHQIFSSIFLIQELSNEKIKIPSEYWMLMIRVDEKKNEQNHPHTQ